MVRDQQESKTNMSVRATMCSTCPFRPGSPYAYLKDDLEASARIKTSRICHSTGSNNAINSRTGLPAHICRGARGVQLEQFYALGFLEAPTDEAWNDKREEIGLPRQIIADPVKKNVRSTQKA